MSDISAVLGRIQSIQSQITQVEQIAAGGFEQLLSGALGGDSGSASAVSGSLSGADSASLATLDRSLAIKGLTGGSAFVRPVSGSVTSNYGMRTHPITGTHTMHDGVDFGAPEGTPIRSSAAGTVSFVGYINGYGNVVIVDHGRGMQTFYAHQSKTIAHKGDRVAAGQTIGLVGSTGNSTGPHLHFEVRRNGEAVNPTPYLNGKKRL